MSPTNSTTQSHSRVIAPPRLNLDQVGMTASLICAVHCAIMPIVLTALPLIGLGFLAHAATEWTLIGLSLALGISSLCLGFRQHRRRRALIVLAVGFAMLAAGRIAEAHESGNLGVGLVVLGGLLVAGAHGINRRLCHACRVCHPLSNHDSHRE